MDATSRRPPMSRWLTEGRTLGESLRRFTCIVVGGSDPDATADVALGIAEAQSRHREVVLGDLFGDADRFAPLRADDDPHGLVDAFDYGISLARVVRPVTGNERLQFAPTGSDVPDYAELLRHPRWQRLIGTFAETERLLVIALPIDAAGLEDLVDQTDGLVIVDSLAPARIEQTRVIATVTAPPALPPSPVVPPPIVAQAETSARTPGAITARSTIMAPPRASGSTAPRPRAPTPAPPSPRQSSTSTPAPRSSSTYGARGTSGTVTPPSRPSGRITTGGPAYRPTGIFTAFAKPAGFGAGLSILGALLIFWLANRPFSRREKSDAPAGETLPTSLKVALPPARVTPRSADPNMVDPADSGAAVYAVQIMAANTQAGAILKLQADGISLPASTYAPVEIAGTTWYKVLAGAYITRGGADSLLTSLRAGGLLDSLSPGIVVRVPYAVRVDSVRNAPTVADLLASLRSGRKLPVYALAQQSGWVWILAGAFETRSQAEAYVEKVRADGHTAELVLRQGRMF